jgi:hypothetical protein
VPVPVFVTVPVNRQAFRFVFDAEMKKLYSVPVSSAQGFFLKYKTKIDNFCFIF